MQWIRRVVAHVKGWFLSLPRAQRFALKAMSILKSETNLKYNYYMDISTRFIKLVYLILFLFTFNACAKDFAPLVGWEFVAVISRDINASVEIIVLKDDNKQFEKEGFMNVLRERFKNMNPLGSTGWVYSMKFTNGKRREILKNVDPQFFKDIERHFTPLTKPSKLP
jgi:hypothetical protein